MTNFKHIFHSTIAKIAHNDDYIAPYTPMSLVGCLRNELQDRIPAAKEGVFFVLVSLESEPRVSYIKDGLFT